VRPRRLAGGRSSGQAQPPGIVDISVTGVDANGVPPAADERSCSIADRARAALTTHAHIHLPA
jgi:hypothetical protein